MTSERTRPGPSEGWPSYMADWRERHPIAVIENRLRQKASSRARLTLKNLYPDEYQSIYEAELERVRLEWAVEQGEGGAATPETTSAHARKRIRQRTQRALLQQWKDELATFPLEAP